METFAALSSYLGTEHAKRIADYVRAVIADERITARGGEAGELREIEAAAWKLMQPHVSGWSNDCPPSRQHSMLENLAQLVTSYGDTRAMLETTREVNRLLQRERDEYRAARDTAEAKLAAWEALRKDIGEVARIAADHNDRNFASWHLKDRIERVRLATLDAAQPEQAGDVCECCGCSPCRVVIACEAEERARAEDAAHPQPSGDGGEGLPGWRAFDGGYVHDSGARVRKSSCKLCATPTWAAWRAENALAFHVCGRTLDEAMRDAVAPPQVTAAPVSAPVQCDAFTQLLDLIEEAGLKPRIRWSHEDIRDREKLGRAVRAVWMAWAREQPNPKPSWLVPWEELSEPDKEVDRRIGEAIARVALDALPKREPTREASAPNSELLPLWLPKRVIPQGEATRNPIFLLQLRTSRKNATRERWETERVFFDRSEAEEWAKARAYNYPNGYRTYSVPAQGALVGLLATLSTYWDGEPYRGALIPASAVHPIAADDGLRAAIAKLAALMESNAEVAREFAANDKWWDGALSVYVDTGKSLRAALGGA
jgi:hypothetical protein